MTRTIFSSRSFPRPARIRNLILVLLISGLGIARLRAEVRLPRIFGDHMVLQRDMPLPVWGWAAPGEKVAVAIDDGPPQTATTEPDGIWRVTLPPMPAGGPHTLTASGKNRVKRADILVGEVWICSGQSNMEFPVSRSRNAQQEIAAANDTRIRQIKVARAPAPRPRNDLEGEWRICSPETVGSFTAAGYFFARDLIRELDVPIGLVNTSWGGTRIEPWTPLEGFAGIPELEAIHLQILRTIPGTPEYEDILKQYIATTETWLAAARKSLDENTPLAPLAPYPAAIKPLTEPRQPTTLYNGMVHPLVPLAIRGALWYQGESNHRDGALYTQKMKALIQGWRQVWNQGDFPFYYVQIAPYKYGNEPYSILPAFWEAQAAALAIPNTGMVVTNDIGNVDNIHPTNKQEVGRRLALLALTGTYGRKGLVWSGPVFREMKIEGSRVRVFFDHVGSGLASRDGKPLDWFEIIGRDTDFMPAKAVIDGDAVVLSAADVRRPAAIRFAWHRNAEPNLMNKEGLPARPFRAGKIPKRDYLALRVPEAKGYRLVYDLDLARLGSKITYDVDHHTDIVPGSFDRIAYFLELQKPREPRQYVYVSMDAFTDDAGKIGIPAVDAKAFFQQNIAHMNVISNVPGIVTGAGLDGGNIEFWPNNYGPMNSAKVPNASSAIWDFGDQPSTPGAGYGCMQVHNHAAKQTVFAINLWKGGAKADLGIGNSRGKTRDWTFTRNASTYEVKRLRVLVRLRR